MSKTNRSNKAFSAWNRFRSQKFRAKKKLLQEAKDRGHDLQETIQSQATDTNSTFSSGFSNDVSINSLIRAWVTCHGITTRAVNDLLKILKSAGWNLMFCLLN